MPSLATVVNGISHFITAVTEQPTELTLELLASFNQAWGKHFLGLKLKHKH